METYSSGMVVGMTGIPACTIRRYIRDFRSFFSLSAQQPNRGRRYTSDDIRMLLSIRHLYAERKSKDKIIAALEGKWTPPAMPRYDIEDATKIIAGAKEILRETKKFSDKAEVQVQRATYATSYLYKSLRNLEDRLEKIEDELSHLKKMRMY